MQALVDVLIVDDLLLGEDGLAGGDTADNGDAVGIASYFLCGRLSRGGNMRLYEIGLTYAEKIGHHFYLVDTRILFSVEPVSDSGVGEPEPLTKLLPADPLIFHIHFDILSHHLFIA